ncbi:SDR family oxidoreductase [Nitratireductor aquimarinus]|uniref:SDR family oxidoreductase n=1 Tax=Nitratireductor TaxID=245876 RepID=UPI0019D3E813|nr:MULTISPECIES: SDR family oxidoreductase [Nitratireductor]MBN7778088.1 SDR family oxidoreductase [Nitratireductor pacificus]MBN7782410.1 SDR family oxidoreductase [Nitratireductor pacificus]MBN7791217.1 SDR family oxidoreductase [Nitratireductor aquimarinus]MBN8244155.1 SDR family oxidoreductase [Nitratireductor aquimarinus]MBY6100297.1 SDR family oxidoreductase [Nitratireductor aquimarinus]
MGQGRTILITGASSGIGAWCASALQKDGWRVFATVRRPEDRAALEAQGIEPLYLDYAEPESIAALVEEVLQRTGGTLDALFNNGAYAQAGAVEDLPVEALRHQFEVNVFGWHDLTRRIVPVMRRQGHGRIVHCSSILGLVPIRFRGAYAASKYALEGLMLCQRAELEGSGIHVSLIEPGPIASKMASNGLPWFERFIDHENSVHREAYEAQLARLRQGGVKSRFKLEPDAVYVQLAHALLSPRPKPHYVVTTPARIGVALKRLLPARMLYSFLSNQG